jgi:hypothetical protein
MDDDQTKGFVERLSAWLLVFTNGVDRAIARQERQERRFEYSWPMIGLEGVLGALLLGGSLGEVLRTDQATLLVGVLIGLAVIIRALLKARVRRESARE